MEKDRAYRPNSDQIIVPPSKLAREKYDKIVEIVRANPGISIGEIRKIYSQNGTFDCARLNGMLTDLCLRNRLKYQDIQRYTAVKAVWTN